MRVFWACVRIVWNGFDEYSGFASIMGALSRSTSLTVPMRESDVISASRTYKACFLWFLLRGIPLPLPICPAFVLFGVLAVGLSASRVLPLVVADFSPWSNAEIAAWIVSKPPPTCSFCFFLKRRIWIFEYGDLADCTPVAMFSTHREWDLRTLAINECLAL